jgi:hypothetical protein
MKKVNKKLSLNRETLASLTTDELAGVAGGDIGPGGTATTLTTGTRTSVPSGLTSRIGCPTRLPGICVPDTVLTRQVCGTQGTQQ